VPEVRVPDRGGLNLAAALPAALEAAPLPAPARTAIGAALERVLATLRHGDADTLDAALAGLPPATPSGHDFGAATVRIGAAADLGPGERERLNVALMALHPWRKGPFELFGVTVDAEWRSDLKWARVAAAASGFAQRRVLDVGCGNGYYAFRLLGAGARFVLGVDPSLRALAQFAALHRYVPAAPACLLPLGGEDLPPALGCFDTVLSMGVLYHRREPLAHLGELLGTLRPGGELVLETLVVPGEADAVLEPRGRYAKMRNVWSIPTRAALLGWVREAGFVQARIADCTATTTTEQRRTPWMRFESLADFLDPADPSRTLEGHPAPLRALLVASRP
jgi:tRNA (mo5U34)-methyltransferase